MKNPVLQRLEERLAEIAAEKQRIKKEQAEHSRQASKLQVALIELTAEERSVKSLYDLVSKYNQT